MLLKPEFFNRNSVTVARDLIGKTLCRSVDGHVVRFRIIETESYEGFRDLASHAHRGQTPRNAPMFGAPATIYIYFTYGMHWMLNIVCGPIGYPAAVLIRGLQSIDHDKIKNEIHSEIISGPARLTKRLNIDKMLNDKKLGKASGLWVESPSSKTEANQGKFKILKTPRIGIDSSGPIWSQKLYRFVLDE